MPAKFGQRKGMKTENNRDVNARAWQYKFAY